MTLSTTNAVPNPGSDEALMRGCTCPVIDNARGRGYRGGAKAKDGSTLFVYTCGCPIHAPALSAQGEADAVLFVNQFDLDRIPEGGDHYIKCRRSSATGNFTTPLYTRPAPAPVPDAVEALRLVKLPVEFRVNAHGQWLHFESEQEAQASADMHGTDYQGLYVRDGTPLAVGTPDRTYYTEGKDCPFYETLSDKDFAWEATKMAQDLADMDTRGLEDILPFVGVLSIAAARLADLASNKPVGDAKPKKAIRDKVAEIRDRVEPTICPTFSSDAGDQGEQGRISRLDFDTLVLAALAASGELGR